mgnify:FL=1
MEKKSTQEEKNKLKEFKQSAVELHKAFIRLNKAWSNFDENLEFDSYPFKDNFIVLIDNVEVWKNEIKEL